MKKEFLLVDWKVVDSVAYLVDKMALYLDNYLAEYSVFESVVTMVVDSVAYLVDKMAVYLDDYLVDCLAGQMAVLTDDK